MYPRRPNRWVPAVSAFPKTSRLYAGAGAASAGKGHQPVRRIYEPNFAASAQQVMTLPIDVQ